MIILMFGVSHWFSLNARSQNFKKSYVFLWKYYDSDLIPPDVFVNAKKLSAEIACG